MKTATVDAAVAAVPEQVVMEQAAPAPVMPEQAAALQAIAPPSAPPLDDRLLQELAKRRLSIKRGLLGQTLDYLLIILVILIFASLSYDGSVYFFAFCFCAFWGLRLAWRWFKFMKPSFKEGMAAYFRQRKEQQLAFEYNRLKQMNAEYVAEELRK